MKQPDHVDDDGARVARRERRREHSREEILEAARTVILRDGLKGMTLVAVARELGLTKAALYYYFPSKEALLRELMHRSQGDQAQALHDAVASTDNGREALRALIRETIEMYAPRLDDFRLNYLHAQVAGADAFRVSAEDLERIRPLNDLAYGGATRLVAADLEGKPNRAGVDPRLMVFLANLAAVGVLTMKGMVETYDDPLLYSDAKIIDALARIFAAAAEPVE